MTFRILFIGEALTLSHVVRPLVLARAAHAAGYQVAFACDDRYAALVGKIPFRWFRLTAALPKGDAKDRLKQTVPLFSVPTLEAQIREDRRLLQLSTPDLVVGDMRHSLAISAREAGIPFATIINAHWAPGTHDLPQPVHHVMRKLLTNTMFDEMYRSLFAVGSTVYNAPLNLVRLRHGRPPLPPDIRHAFFDADHILLADAPEFPAVGKLPENAMYLGPILWAPDIDLPPWWDDVSATQPVIYVNLGSSGEPGILPQIADGLTALGANVMIATTGNQAITPRTGFFITDFLPGDVALRRSSLAVLSGGSMAAQPALCAGVPVLAIPSNGDQLIYARLIAREGAGEVVTEAEINSATIRRIASQMLREPRYAENARRLGAMLRERNAEQSFVDFLRDTELTTALRSGTR